MRRDLRSERVSAIIRKGTNPDVDSYSGFRNNWDDQGRRPPTGLTGYLRENGIRRLRLRARARLLREMDRGRRGRSRLRDDRAWDLTRAVNPAHDGVVSTALRDKRVQIGESASLR